MGTGAGVGSAGLSGGVGLTAVDAPLGAPRCSVGGWDVSAVATVSVGVAAVSMGSPGPGVLLPFNTYLRDKETNSTILTLWLYIQ